MREIRPWEVLYSEYLLQRRWLNLRRDRVMTGRGVTIDEFHVLEYPSWACTCCVTTDGQLVLIRQYRHGVGRVTLELPAGVIESTETPLAGAKRELLEETGFASDQWTPLTSLAPEPARHTNLAHCFIASAATEVDKPTLDDAEDLRVETVPLSDVRRLIDSGGITHAVHVAALLLALSRGYFDA